MGPVSKDGKYFRPLSVQTEKGGKRFHIGNGKKLQPLDTAGAWCRNEGENDAKKLVFPLEGFYLGELLQGLFHDGFDLVKGSGGFAFAAGYEDRLGVGGTDQAPALGEKNADAVYIYDGILLVKKMAQIVYHLELGGIGTGDAGFGGAVVAGSVGQEGRQGPIGMGKEAEQAAGGVEGIVVAVVFVGKEHVTRHFAGEDGADLAHTGFNEGMAGAGEFGPAAETLYFVYQGLRAFYFYQGNSTGVLGQDLAPEEDHELVSPKDVALIVYGAEAVAVAIEAEAKIGPLLLYQSNEVLKMSGLDGIGRVVRKGGVGSAVQGQDLTAQAG